MNRLFVAVLMAGLVVALFLFRYQPSSAPEALLATDVRNGMDLPLSMLEEPYVLPALQFVDAGNRPLSLEDFEGKVLLLNIWATWCPPCREEMPALDRLQRRLGGQDFQVVPLSTDLDGLVAVESFYREAGISSLAMFLDQNGNVPIALKVPGLPATYLIDRRGRALGVKFGPAEWDSDAVISLIRRYL